MDSELSNILADLDYPDDLCILSHTRANILDDQRQKALESGRKLNTQKKVLISVTFLFDISLYIFLLRYITILINESFYLNTTIQLTYPFYGLMMMILLI